MDIKKIQKNFEGGGVLAITIVYAQRNTKLYLIHIKESQKLQIGSVALGNFLRAYFVQ